MKSFQPPANDPLTSSSPSSTATNSNSITNALQNSRNTGNTLVKNVNVMLDDMITEEARNEVLGVGHFYDHAGSATVWGQDIIYAFYADDNTTYPLTFRLFEQQDEDNEDHDTKYDLARDIVMELDEEGGLPADFYLFDLWFAYDSGLLHHIKSDGKDWIGPFRSNPQVTYAGNESPVDALAERIDTAERTIEDDTYHIWTRMLPISQLGAVKLVLAGEESNEDEDNPVKDIATNKIDTPTAHLIRSYAMHWRIEPFFEDSNQDVGLRDCELQTDEGACRHRHLLMAAYSLVRLGPDSRTLGMVRSKASSLRANLEYSLKDAVYNLLSWVRHKDDRDVTDLVNEIDHRFVHSTAEATVQS